MLKVTLFFLYKKLYATLPNPANTENDPGYDPQIRMKLSQKEAVEYFILLSIQGLQRVLQTKKFVCAVVTFVPNAWLIRFEKVSLLISLNPFARQNSQYRLYTFAVGSFRIESVPTSSMNANKDIYISA